MFAGAGPFIFVHFVNEGIGGRTVGNSEAYIVSCRP